jgi:hypothetical protein
MHCSHCSLCSSLGCCLHTVGNVGCVLLRGACAHVMQHNQRCSSAEEFDMGGGDGKHSRWPSPPMHAPGQRSDKRGQR